MRLLFYVAFVCLTSGQNCSERIEVGHKECQNYDIAGTIHVRNRRAVTNMTEAVKKTLDVASKVTNELASFKVTEDFASYFLKLKPERVIDALKGISVAASLVSALLGVPSEGEKNTKMILDRLDEGFETLSKRMAIQTNEVKSYIDHKFFQNNVVDPVKTASQWMNIYKKNSSKVLKERFLMEFRNAKLQQVITRIINSAGDILDNTMKHTRYNVNKFNKMAGTLTRNFHEAFTIEFFSMGVVYPPDDHSFKQLQATMINHYTGQRNELSKIILKANETFDNSFYSSGFIEDDIIKPAIDKGNSNANISAIISNKLNTQYPRHKFAAIVAQDPNQQFAFYGIPNRYIYVYYKYKIVLAFMASGDPDLGRTVFLYYYQKEHILGEVSDKFDEDNLNPLLDWPRSQGTYQMAVFFEYTRPTIASTKTNLTEQFDHTVIKSEPFIKTKLVFFAVF